MPKQVEVNLMAAGLGCISQNLVRHHRQLLRMVGLSDEEVKSKVNDDFYIFSLFLRKSRYYFFHSLTIRNNCMYSVESIKQRWASQNYA